MRTSPSRASAASGMVTVAAVLALAVVGTGAAFAYRTYVGSPAQRRAADHQGRQQPDQGRAGARPMAAPPRCRTACRPATAARRSYRARRRRSTSMPSPAPRMVFPPLNQNGNPPPVASVAPGCAAAGNAGERHDAEQRAAQDQDAHRQGRAAENGGVPAGVRLAPAKPAGCHAGGCRRPPPRPRNPSSANASANAPLSLSPQARQQPDPAPRPRASPPPIRRDCSARPPAAAIWCRSPRSGTRPTRRPPTGRCRASSRRAGLALAVDQARRSRRKGVYYRAMVGPFASSEEASQFCGSLKAAGGQCFVQRN